MEFLYQIINFLILAALIWLIGRKMIVSIFADRLARINRELDETERIEHAEMSLPEIPTAFSEDIPQPILHEVDEIRAHAEKEAQNVLRQTEGELHDMRREMLSGVRDTFMRKLTGRIAELVRTEPYLSQLRKKEAEFADMIIERMEVTPGDMAYLRRAGVLYVTLTSAYELPQEIVDKIGHHATEMLAKIGGTPSYWVKVDPNLIGGLRFRVGDTVYDCTVEDRLYELRRELERREISGDEDADALVADILTGIMGAQYDVNEYQLGRVISISDGICWLDGLSDIMYGEVIEFECGERGMVLDIEPDRIGCVIYGKFEHIESGSRVRRVGRIASVPCGNELLGRVINPLGHALDGKGRIWAKERRPIECKSPSIPDRAAVFRPMHTGIKAIDALVPIGRGQRELIIGDRQSGKTSVVIDTIINQKGKDTVCIYVAIGQKDTTVADIREKLTKYGAMEYTTIVCAPASASASFQYIAPFAGTAMAEYFMYQGRDVLIIYDDLSKHAVAYRELSLLLHRPSGREAYPGDVFYLHSRLLERAAQLSPENGGGSITALPIIETQAGDISAYIPTNVISITDGQIFLDSDLFNEGQRPAVNVGLSVSRVGSAAQTPLMKQVSSRLRMELAQYRELVGFTQFGSDLDSATKRVLDAGERMMSALRQGRYAPLPDWKQALLIYAVAEGYAATVSPADMEAYAEEMYSYFEGMQPDVTEMLRSGKKMGDSDKKLLNEALSAFCESHTGSDSEVA